MKKIFVCFALFAALIFATGCGSSSKNNNQNDNSDTGDTVTDDDGDSGDSDSADTDPSDSGHEDSDITPEQPDNGDTTPDNGDTTPDNGDSMPDSDNDSSDSAPDSDETAPVNENPDNLPECSPTSATPCIDSATGLIWSGKAPERIRWIDAVDYCKNLNEGGYSDWRLPSLAVLRTLVKECESNGYSDGECSKFGDIVFFWSSSSQGQGVFFYNGTTQSKSVDENFDARCVRREGPETRQIICTGLPENAEWNTVSEITQTWDWNKGTWDEEQMWTPSSSGSYNKESSMTECRFKCEENYFWDYSTEKCLNPCDPDLCTAITNSVCIATSATHFSCSGGTDPETGLTWSSKAPSTYTHSSAGSYCSNLDESGYTDWRLPDLYTLKTLYSYSDENVCYSKLRDTDGFWSSSPDNSWPTGTYYYVVSFSSNTCWAGGAEINPYHLYPPTYSVRCVRNAE